MRRLFYGLTLVSFLLGCSHYRSNHTGYRGIGGYRVGSDYSRETASEPPPFSNSSFRLKWPVDHVKLNRGYRPDSDPNHHGVDLGGRRGEPIFAAHDGVVIYAGNEFRGYGNMVLVEYSNEWATLYAHLDKILIKTGQVVKAGAAIGTMGQTGAATGVHLHFELLRDRQPVDPLHHLSTIAER